MPVETTFFSTKTSSLSLEESDFQAAVPAEVADFTATVLCDVNNFVSAVHLALPVSDSDSSEEQPLYDADGSTPYVAKTDALLFRSAIITGLKGAQAANASGSLASQEQVQFKLILDELFGGLNAAEQLTDAKAHAMTTDVDIVGNWLMSDAQMGSSLAQGGSAFNTNNGTDATTTDGFLYSSSTVSSSTDTDCLYHYGQLEDILDGIRLGGRYSRTAGTGNDEHRVALKVGDKIRIPVDLSTGTDNVISVNFILQQQNDA